MMEEMKERKREREKEKIPRLSAGRN